MSDEIDDLEAALRASGWATQSTKTLLSEDDMAVAARLLGETNARRMAATPRGRKPRLVHTKEVYAVENSRGWMVGAIEGGKRRVLAQDLPWSECKRGLEIAEARGFKTAVHANHVRQRQPVTRRSSTPWIDPHIEAPRSKPATPSKHIGPSKVLAILDRLRDFKA